MSTLEKNLSILGVFSCSPYPGHLISRYLTSGHLLGHYYFALNSYKMVSVFYSVDLQNYFILYFKLEIMNSSIECGVLYHYFLLESGVYYRISDSSLQAIFENAVRGGGSFSVSFNCFTNESPLKGEWVIVTIA